MSTPDSTEHDVVVSTEGTFAAQLVLGSGELFAIVGGGDGARVKPLPGVMAPTTCSFAFVGGRP